MAKFRPAGKRSRPAAQPRAAVPCLIILIMALGIVCLIFYFSMQSGT